jgi:plastocyanin
MHAASPAVAIAVIALAAAGCGEKRHTSNAGTASSSAVTMSETEFKLNPSTPSVGPGGTISIKNAGATTHALEIVTPSGEVKTNPISPGQSAAIKAPAKAGTYNIYCPIDHHKQKGMTGKLTVGGSGGSSGGGSSTNSSGGGGGGGY